MKTKIMIFLTILTLVTDADASSVDKDGETQKVMEALSFALEAPGADSFYGTATFYRQEQGRIYLMTNAHVLGEDPDFWKQIRLKGNQESIEVHGVSFGYDLALISVSKRDVKDRLSALKKIGSIHSLLPQGADKKLNFHTFSVTGVLSHADQRQVVEPIYWQKQDRSAVSVRLIDRGCPFLFLRHCLLLESPLYGYSGSPIFSKNILNNKFNAVGLQSAFVSGAPISYGILLEDAVRVMDWMSGKNTTGVIAENIEGNLISTAPKRITILEPIHRLYKKTLEARNLSVSQAGGQASGGGGQASGGGGQASGGGGQASGGGGQASGEMSLDGMPFFDLYKRAKKVSATVRNPLLWAETPVTRVDSKELYQSIFDLLDGESQKTSAPDCNPSPSHGTLFSMNYLGVISSDGLFSIPDILSEPVDELTARRTNRIASGSLSRDPNHSTDLLLQYQIPLMKRPHQIQFTSDQSSIAKGDRCVFWGSFTLQSDRSSYEGIGFITLAQNVSQNEQQLFFYGIIRTHDPSASTYRSISIYMSSR